MTNPDIAVRAHTDSLAQATVNALNGWWDETDADEVDGFDLLKDAALFQLVGVPFMGFRVVFRDGIQRKGNEYRDDFASLELRTAPLAVMQRDMSRIMSRRVANKIDEAALMNIVQPEESLVVNDGSTGLYRQIVQYLAAKELIKLPVGQEVGEKGETIFDLPRSQWLEGAEAATEGIDIQLRCARGLRFSEYPSEYLPEGEMARTWYLA
jgi:hypothetical protein